MKRILFYTDNLKIGGIRTVALSYLKLLVANPDYQVDLLLNNQPRDNVFDLLPKSINKHYICTDAENEFEVFCTLVLGGGISINRPKEYFQSWANAIRHKYKQNLLHYLNDRPSYDVIINFNGDLEAFLCDYDINQYTKIIRIVHSDIDIKRLHNNPNYHRIVLDKQQAFILIAEDMQRHFEQRAEQIGLNLAPKKVVTLYNPIDRETILHKLTINNNDPVLQQDYILSVGGLYDGKNQIQMLDIYATLKQKGVNQKLYIIGEGYTRSQLSEKITALGLENDCFLLGLKDNPFPYMQNAKLFIHTSLNEGLPTVFIESMICGTPIVAFDCPTGVREILDNGNYGGLIPMGDEQAFVNKVYQLLNDENQRQAYIDKFPEAVERFSFERIGSQLYQLIDDLSEKR
ncbi:glycosyltransferase [Lonepinella sp. BR2271]|uniref:glycosyltransferase n=1 Tax=Lonepinella sp. BR2271 TaxID=3434550 RepID=UPI003F6E12C8